MNLKLFIIVLKMLAVLHELLTYIVFSMLYTSLAIWWLGLKTLSGIQCFAKGRKQIFCAQSLFDMVKQEIF